MAQSASERVRETGVSVRRKETVERGLARLLISRGLTLAVAESCTGGLIGQRITSVSGSSQYFAGGVISYSNDVKVRLLGVSAKVLESAGAVSRETAAAMAQGVRRLCRADIGVSCTGIAGPGGGTSAKPVGLVYIAVSGRRGGKVTGFRFCGNRAAIRRQASEQALKMVLINWK
jgi:PncC family amidohydrolase